MAHVGLCDDWSLTLQCCTHACAVDVFQTEEDAAAPRRGPRAVARVVTAHRQREGAGFIVRRPIGGEVDMVDPFLLLDHLVSGEPVG